MDILLCNHERQDHDKKCLDDVASKRSGEGKYKFMAIWHVSHSMTSYWVVFVV